jgi:hypothetical protein
MKDAAEAEKYVSEPKSPVGWYYQQLLKFYALFVIPNISSNVLLLDSDTIFLNPVEFLDPTTFAGQYDPTFIHHEPYFEHARKLVPNFKKIHPDYSGVANHMLIQRCVLEDLFGYVESHHGKPFWIAFCDLVAPNHVRGAGASEYEIYFNFAFARTDQVKLRSLWWNISDDLSTMSYFQGHHYHYISYHQHLRAP